MIVFSLSVFLTLDIHVPLFNYLSPHTLLLFQGVLAKFLFLCMTVNVSMVAYLLNLYILVVKSVFVLIGFWYLSCNTLTSFCEFPPLQIVMKIKSNKRRKTEISIYVCFKCDFITMDICGLCLLWYNSRILSVLVFIGQIFLCLIKNISTMEKLTSGHREYVSSHCWLDNSGSCIQIGRLSKVRHFRIIM